MKRLLLSLALPAMLLTGCSSVTDGIPGYLKPYRPDVQQGNIVTSEMVDSLRVGMTVNQVIFLLGTPMLQSVFHRNEFDYIYYFNPRFGSPATRKLTVVFNAEGRVASFRSDKMPDETNVDLEILGERARKETLESRKSAVMPSEADIKRQSEATEMVSPPKAKTQGGKSEGQKY